MRRYWGLLNVYNMIVDSPFGVIMYGMKLHF